MTTWKGLYEQHCSMRSAVADLISAVRRPLLGLAARKHCAETIGGRWTRHERGDLRELHIRSADGGVGEPLLALPTLVEARLNVLALLSRKQDHLHQFTATIEGKRAQDRSPWIAAVHLQDDRQANTLDRHGDGACSHAAFHCHVGPTLETEPKVRVPLPAVGPVGALDWLLAIVVPGWEPAPWSVVVEALARERVAVATKSMR